MTSTGWPSDKFLRSIFRYGANNAAQWFETAKSLRRSAEVLLPIIESELEATPSLAPTDLRAPHMDHVYMLLIGLSAENLAKGVAIAKRPEFVANDKMKLGIHVSRALFEQAHIDLSDEEKVLVDRLETHVLWAGRYPIPKDYLSLYPERKPTNSPIPLHYISEPGIAFISTFMNRLESELWPFITPEQLKMYMPLDGSPWWKE
jgi:hypothetical protein